MKVCQQGQHFLEVLLYTVVFCGDGLAKFVDNVLNSSFFNFQEKMKQVFTVSVVGFQLGDSRKELVRGPNAVLVT